MTGNDLKLFEPGTPSHQAPQLVANLPVAIELGHPTGSLDPKLPLEFGRLDSPERMG